MSGGSFSKVGVVGLGTMGAGIAEVLARGGLAVVGIEINDEALARGRGHLDDSTGRAVKRGKLTEEGRREILDRITLSTAFADLADCDLVIEAVPERLELKRRVFAELDKVCRADAVLATNTSSLSVTDIAITTGRPAQVVGVHFFNPAPVMRLVEVIGTVVTEPGAVTRVADLVRGLGKTPVVVGDRAGFVANRLLFGYLNQAAAMYGSGHATLEDIDTAMKVGAGLPMGPFTLMDLIGLDTCLEVLEAIYRETRDRRHAPAPVLRELVTAGLLGRKTGRGFHPYGSAAEPAAAPSAETAQPLVGVVGSGPLAVAVVARCARAGSQVRYVAGDAEKAESAGAALEEALTAEELARVTGGSELDGLADCDLVIEAVAEDVSMKRSVLAAVDDVARPGAVLATTASTVPVIELAMATDRPADVVGLHFPEADGPLVEVVPTVVTDPQTADRATALAAGLGLTAVRCRDRAGFIVDALRFPYLNDAVRMLEAGYADADSIDAAMTLGCGYPTGPIADLDRLGLDRAVAVLHALYTESREAALAPAPLLEEYVTAGHSFRTQTT
ncbi:3-hydroxybutyryl-CoA dehydrogenase [Thermomonospora echinospora]|uniref:3-hydroxybutyryl-CoA dehydrogenase n=1 Tax=Thermomonospora echinospora TaxID=1992 RepID=A0A1H5VW61_9ACTN|nr:3-hydroxyacyl-CoA dehydrogenase [Thermomonospora echinospora]SEF91101.1 3-hydroxybutyryl-CoA dehydrogenase [Thermomonospora echinospora]